MFFSELKSSLEKLLFFNKRGTYLWWLFMTVERTSRGRSRNSSLNFPTIKSGHSTKSINSLSSTSERSGFRFSDWDVWFIRFSIFSFLSSRLTKTLFCFNNSKKLSTCWTSKTSFNSLWLFDLLLIWIFGSHSSNAKSRISSL